MTPEPDVCNHPLGDANPLFIKGFSFLEQFCSRYRISILWHILLFFAAIVYQILYHHRAILDRNHIALCLVGPTL